MKHFTFTQRSFVIVIIGVVGLIGLNLTGAEAASTTVSQVINSGFLTMVPSQTHADLTPVTLSHTQGQGSTGSLGSIYIDDSRGNTPGWSLAASFSNLVSISTFADDNDNAPFTVSGTYTGSSDADYDLTTGSGSTGTRRGQMNYTLSGPSGQLVASTLLATQAIGSTGLSFAASDIDYPAATTYHLHVHVIPATYFVVTPKTVTSAIGSLSGVSRGIPQAGPTATNPITLATANKGFGDGYYVAGADISIAIPAGTHPGNYTGQVVETIN
jgi:hypothetical protein